MRYARTFAVVLTVLCGLAWFGVAWAAPPPLEVYGALPKTEELALSPNGKLVAMVSTAGDKRVLTVSEIDGAVLTTIDAGDVKVASLEWAGDDNLIVYTHQTARLGVEFEFDQEFLQGVVVKVSTGKISPLLPESASYLPAVFGRYGFAQEDGHWYGYFGVIPTDASKDTSKTSGFMKQGYPDLYRVDLDTGSARHVAFGSIYNRRWAVDNTGQIVAVSDYNGKNEGGDWKVYRPDSSSTPVAAGHADFDFVMVGLGRAPGTVLVNTSDEDDGHISEMRLSDGHVDKFLPGGEVSDLIYSPVTGLLLAAQIKGADNQILAFDPTLDRHWKSIEKAFPGKFLDLVSVSADLNRIVVKVTGGDMAGTWQLVDFTTGKAEPLADAYPDIPDGMVGEVRQIEYKAADGLTIPAILTLPPGRAAHGLPLVVLPHGGPEAVDRPGFDWWAQAFASRGYAVLQPNFRGSAGYGAQFRNAGFGQWGRKMQTDVSDGIGFLAGQGIADPKRVCIVGGSYGGYVALAGVTLQQGLYRCAASYGGVSDLEWFLINIRERAGRDYMGPETRYWDKYLGIGSSGSDALDTISPQKHAGQADAPVLLIYGSKDTVVPTDQSEDMASALKRAGKPVEILRLDGEDHWLSRSATRLQMLTAMMSFVEKYNPSDAPSDQAAVH